MCQNLVLCTFFQYLKPHFLTTCTGESMKLVLIAIPIQKTWPFFPHVCQWEFLLRLTKCVVIQLSQIIVDSLNASLLRRSLKQWLPFMKTNHSWSGPTRFAVGTEVIQQNKWAVIPDYNYRSRYQNKSV